LLFLWERRFSAMSIQVTHGAVGKHKRCRKSLARRLRGGTQNTAQSYTVVRSLHGLGGETSGVIARAVRRERAVKA